MWQSRPAFRRILLQLFDSSRNSPGRAGAGASSLCPWRSAGALRSYSSSKASPFSEIYDSFHRASHLLFIKRKDVEGGIGSGTTTAAESDQDSDGSSVPDLRSLFPERDHDDPSASMARFSLEVCSNKTISLKTRREAMKIIGQLAWGKPGSLEKYELVNPILQAMFPLLVADDERGLSSDAFSVIRGISINCHPERVFPPVLEFASLSSQNTNPKHRDAAVEALGDIAEGCSELMKDNMETLLGIVLGAHRDAEKTVRETASLALQRFVDHLKPQMISQRQSVLPCLLDALDEDNDFIEKTSYESLESLCPYMTGEEILPYLDPIMKKLLGELQFGSVGRQLRSFDAICSVAAAAGQHFVPYAERVLKVLTRPGECFLGTYEVVFAGVLVTTVGRAGAEPMLAPYIEAAVSEAANVWNNQIFGNSQRRYTYGFFCTVAETLGDGFAKYLPGVVPLAISSCNLDEDSPGTDYTERMEVLDEKAGATRALGLFAVHTKSAFEPYLEESITVMTKFSAHQHEDVRLQGVIGLKNLLTAAASLSESPNDGAAKAEQVLGTVMDHYIKAMDEDGDKRIVAQVCANMVGILEDFGYAALEPYMRQVIDSALRLLRGQSACQRADDAEHDEELMAAVSNLLSALAKAPSMSSMLSDALVKLSAAPGSSQYRTTAVAIHAEVAHNLDASISACPR